MRIGPGIAWIYYTVRLCRLSTRVYIPSVYVILPPSITIDGLQLPAAGPLHSEKSLRTSALGQPHIVRVGTNLFADIPPEMDGPWFRRIFSYSPLFSLASLYMFMDVCVQHSGEDESGKKTIYKRQKKIGKKNGVDFK